MSEGLVATPGATFYPRLEWPTSGLAGTIGVRVIRDSDGVEVTARTTAGISETPATSGHYVATMVAPSTAGEYTIFWDDGALTPGHSATEDLAVTYSASVLAAPAGTDLCTLAQVRSYLRKPVGLELGQDDIIAQFITDATPVLENYCGRELSPKGTLTRAFQMSGRLVDFDQYGLRTASAVTLDPLGTPVVLTSSQYRQGAVTLPALGTCSQLQLASTLATYSTALRDFGNAEVTVTGTWGPAAVPADVNHAAVVTVGLWVRREVSARGSLNPDIDVDGFDLRPLSMPGAAQRMLLPYLRLRMA